MALCFRESVAQEDGACVPATATTRQSVGVSNAEAQLRMSLPSVSELGAEDPHGVEERWGAGALGLGERNFMAEILAEEAAERAARGENWLELPKDGYPTGEAWALPRQAALDAEIDQLEVRAGQLEDARRELFHLLTDADWVGRVLNGDDSEVRRELRDAGSAHIRVLDSINLARANNELALDFPEYEQIQAVARSAVRDGHRALEQGERILDYATGAAQKKADKCVTGLKAAEFAGKVAVTGLTAGHGALVAGAAAGLGEAAKQGSELYHKDGPLTGSDYLKAGGHVVLSAAMGAGGTKLPGVDTPGLKQVATEVGKGAGTGMVETTGHNLIDGKPALSGVGSAGVENGVLGPMGPMFERVLQ